jgi:hypothetical protein
MAPALRPRPPPVPSTPVAPQKPKPAPRKRKSAAESKLAAAQKVADKTKLAQTQADALVDVAQLEDSACKKRIRSNTTVSRAADDLKRSRVEQSPPTSPGMEGALAALAVYQNVTVLSRSAENQVAIEERADASDNQEDEDLSDDEQERADGDEEKHAGPTQQDVDEDSEQGSPAVQAIVPSQMVTDLRREPSRRWDRSRRYCVYSFSEGCC